MRIAIVGSRGFCDYKALDEYMQRLLQNIPVGTPITVICGGARGADSLGAKWAKVHNHNVEYFIPDWEAHGKRAGYLRNEVMTKTCTHCVAFWDGNSRGTKHMIEYCRAAHRPTRVYRY